ncbi:MAG: hypothetical protein JSS98_05515 [Bacteroidetes bacterium]|nr:hypothetical protein [Bacteroidota bacterium]
MPTINAILKELKNVPVDKLEDLYSIIHSLRTNIKNTNTKSLEILSYAGSFGDMSKSDYGNFVKHTKQVRNELFDRNINL